MGLLFAESVPVFILLVYLQRPCPEEALGFQPILLSLFPTLQDRILRYGVVDPEGKSAVSLHTLPGECVLQRATLVRKKLSVREGGGWRSGTLFCTHFRVAFVPKDSPKRDENTDLVFLEDHDVALASIEKVVAVGASRTKVVTANSTLKFAPEELLLYCKDFQVFCFLFDRLTPDTQVMEMTCAIARAYQPPRPGAVLAFQNSAMGKMKQFLSNRQRDTSMNWFEAAADWEAELERTGTVGWRVSGINERFEMAASLPRFNVVPQKVLDTELKNTFAHFSDGRIPRWCWRHPSGADLLRMASFQNDIYHERDDVRNLEALVFGGQRQCVIVELVEEMPTPADIHVARTRLRALCLGDVSLPVAVPDDKWLSTLEGTHWLDHVRCCLRKAAEVSRLLREGHLTVILQALDLAVFTELFPFAEADDRDLNCVVTSLVQVMCDPHCRTVTGFQGLVQKEWVMAGHRFLNRFNYHRDRDKEEFRACVHVGVGIYSIPLPPKASLFLFLFDHLTSVTFLANCELERSRHTKHLPQCYTPVNGWREGLLPPGPNSLLDPPLPPVWDWALQYSICKRACFIQPRPPAAPRPPVLNGNLNLSKLLPWRAGGGATPYRKSHRRAPSAEESPAPERLLRAWNLTDASAPTPHQDPWEPLLPLLLAPCVGLWKECYLRGALQAQACCQPELTSCHLVEQLSQEVQRLKEALAPPSAPKAADSGGERRVQ
ncbi:myotubularin-related protein 11-like [Scleropages formosus]|uniref:Myotubularin-related protein 11-like n=1 Tax=Scleropages formosus TaxID=113540 RepID=A0A0P7VH24_SCLFO|nr:myotubularin-related protein 11-like [Scleropages formosus]